jgi:5-methylthioribose kinase
MPAPAPTPLDDRSLPDWLRTAGLALDDDAIVVAPAGDGNINWVRRASVPASGVSWIVKQARPALERFPEYSASTERIVFEERWLAIARTVDHESVCPAVLHFDESARVLVLEDLGDAERLDHALLRGAAVDASLHAVARLLARVHGATRDPALAHDPAGGARLATRFANADMQTLHGEHVFRLPFAPNEFPLEPALRARTERVWQDAELRAIASRAYERYRTPHGALVHGDVQAGNILLPATGGAKLLDAEIAHVGDPAFDVGTLLAHVLLAALARQALVAAAPTCTSTWHTYSAAGDGAAPSFVDVARYAGIEMLRRTIGAARVVAVADTRTALAAVDLASQLIRHPAASAAALAHELATFETDLRTASAAPASGGNP